MSLTKHKKILILGVILFGLAVFFLFRFIGINSSSCHELSSLNIPVASKQILLVKSLGGIKAEITACYRTTEWKQALFSTPVEAVIGKKGLADLGHKQEGDLKTPAGLYPIEWTFGTEPLGLSMDFKYITQEDKFIDDPKHPDYNTWVNGETSAKSYELMLIPQYKMGAVINYNMTPTIPGAGSAIFIHLWRSANQGTAGCVALSERNLWLLLQWLNKQKHPYILIK